jgi:hypothetical protein
MKRIRRRAKIGIGFTSASRAGRSSFRTTARSTLQSEHDVDGVVVIHLEERILIVGCPSCGLVVANIHFILGADAAEQRLAIAIIYAYRPDIAWATLAVWEFQPEGAIGIIVAAGLVAGYLHVMPRFERQSVESGNCAISVEQLCGDLNQVRADVAVVILLIAVPGTVRKQDQGYDGGANGEQLARPPRPLELLPTRHVR